MLTPLIAHYSQLTSVLAMEFTFSIYKQLLDALQSSGYSFQTVESFIRDPQQKTVIMRHDVDKLPGNALKMAKLENGIGVVATYYFRAIPESFDEGIMREIAGMGHEIGYHYENIDSVIEELKDLGIEGWGNCGLRISDCGLRIANFGLRITDCEFRIGKAEEIKEEDSEAECVWKRE